MERDRKQWEWALDEELIAVGQPVSFLSEAEHYWAAHFTPTGAAQAIIDARQAASTWCAMSAPPRDDERRACDEKIEITPEMIAAGVAAYFNDFRRGEEERVVVEIFKAMWRAQKGG